MLAMRENFPAGRRPRRTGRAASSTSAVLDRPGQRWASPASLECCRTATPILPLDGAAFAPHLDGIAQLVVSVVAVLNMDDAFEALVSNFLDQCRDEERDDLRSFSRSGTVEGVIADSTRSTRPDGSRHPHQWRLPRTVLDDAHDRLLPLQEAIAAARDFDDLHQRVERAILPIHGVGALLVYDVASRIGAFLGIEPDVVYLHRGTRDGARLLGHRGCTVAVAALPRAFHCLTAAEIEDCLCLYKSHIHEIVAGHHTVASKRSSAACGGRAAQGPACGRGHSKMVVDRPTSGSPTAG